MVSSRPTTNKPSLFTTGVGVFCFLTMNKEKYLSKLAWAKSDIRVLIASTRAGITKVHLERIEESMQKVYNELADMPEDKFEEFISK